MEFYGDIPIRGTQNKRQFVKFREGKPKQKPKAKNFKISLDKRAWLNYTGNTREQSNN